MVCKIDYIQKAPISDTEKSRLEAIHVDIFNEAKKSDSFRSFEGKLYTLKHDYAKGTNFVSIINERHNAPITRIETKAPGQHFLTVNVLPLAAEKQGEIFANKSGMSEASPETVNRMRKVLYAMGIRLEDLNEYAKRTGLDVSNIGGIADLSYGVVALAEGMESEAITEETVHIAVEMLEYTNPKMVTEMISKIDRFKIYQRTYEQYKSNANYKLPNGKPDIRKIKIEAVGKLIAEVIVNQNAEIEQNPELREEINQSLVRKWWQDLLDFIKGLYRSTNLTIFEQAAEDIVSGNILTEDLLPTESSVFFNLTDPQKGIVSKLKETDDAIKKVESTEKADPILLETEEATSFYRTKDANGDWVKIPKRVTDRVKKWYRERFGTKIFSDKEKEFNELKRTYGIQGHKDLEEIHTRFYNPDGTKREKPIEKPSKYNLPAQAMYDKLEKYFTDLVSSFPEGTLVFSETIVFDPKEREAGTIDFLAIEPTGKAHIFDWKFMSISPGQQDVAWYKQGAYNIQIGRYKDILREKYGVKEFGMMRAIPIIMKIEGRNLTEENSPKVLKGIAVGTVDASKIASMNLLPVSEESESTGYPALDNVIGKLNGYLKQIAKERTYSEEDKKFKAERLSVLSRAVRLAHTTLNVLPLIDVIEVMRKEGDRIIGEYNVTYKDRPAQSDDSTDSNLSDFSEEMRDYIKLSEVFTDIGDDLGQLIYTEEMTKEAKTPEEKKELENKRGYLNKLNEESRLIRISRKQILEAANKFADKHIGERNLVAGLLKPEKIVKGLSSMFRGVSDLPLRSLELLHKITRFAQGRASEDALKNINKLLEIRKKLEARGGDIRDLVKQIYVKDDKGKSTNRLIYKYKKEFFDEVDKNVENKDMKWLMDNIDTKSYMNEAKQVIDKQIEYINKTRYKGTKEQEEEFREQEIEKVKKQFDITHPDFNGWNNYVIKRHPLDKWFSEDYKKIKDDVDLLKLYEFIVDEINEKAKDVGYISNTVSKTFLPFVTKSMAEQLAWDHKLSVIDNFQKSVQFRASDVGYGNINQVTGELENSIPKYYTQDFTVVKDKEGIPVLDEKGNKIHDYSEVSEELFKNLILYIQQVEKYKYMTEVEGQIKLIKTVEEFKDHLNTGRSGNVVMKDGKPEILTGNAENTKMFDDFMRVLLYDQRYVLSDTDTPLNVGKVVNFVKRSINKVAGREVWKEEENPTPTSLVKTIDAANRGFQLKTLGFEFISGAVNMFGGNIQVATQAGNYFKAREFAKNEAKLTTQAFRNEEEKDKFAQLVNTFMPMKDDPAYQLYNKAGMTSLTRHNLSDMLMVFMRVPEQLIEKAVFLSLLENTMIVDGKIVSITEFVRNKNRDRFQSATKYNESKRSIDAEIEELKNTKSIAVTAELKDGKLVIPGLDLSNREELQRLTNLSRRISRNATGGLSDGDVNRMSMSIWTRSMMIFKNWIPKLADTRFSEFRRVADDFSVRIDEDGIPTGQKYEIGRIRLLAYVLSAGITKGVRNLHNIMYLNQLGLNRLDEMFEEFRAKYEAETGEVLTITREDFIDLIRTNLRNQLKELAIFGGLFGVMLGLGFVAPDDDQDKASKNFHRYALRVVDKFVSELSFFYNPAELESILSGGIFPAIGIVKDFERFVHHFWLQTTGLDMDPTTSFEDVRKKALPIKYAMKMAPISKSLVTYLAIFNEDFAKEFKVTISKENNR